ncbi:MAG: hypothetical protein ACLR8Y_18145 [Alistipes indistinctus]
MNQSTWIWIILLYYILATLLPIDKIIGRIYPLFGAALFFMALGILYVLLFDAYTIPELSAGNWHNFKTDAARFPDFPRCSLPSHAEPYRVFRHPVAAYGALPAK